MRYNKILKNLFNLNRHHISPDTDLAVDKLCKTYGGNIEQYTDNKKLSWRIPPGYKVIKAELKDSEGKLICSHDNNPMHLWSYSPSFSGVLSYSELIEHIWVDFERPKAILFHFRNQFRFWDPIWGFSLNVEQFESLDKNQKFHVDIKTEFYQAPLKQFLFNKPLKKNNVILVAHLDHYFQLNDGLGSAIVNNEVVSELKGKLNNINICSLNSIEIIGSIYFLNEYNLNASNTIAAISTNGLTLDNDFIFQLSGKKDSIINKLIKLYNLLYKSKSNLEEFREGWGNDEIAFEVPGVSIPCASVHRGPHKNYHTHLDNFSSFSDTSFNESKNLIKNLILDLDQNYRIEIKNWNGLICLAHPDINLYIEPSNVSGRSQKSNIEIISFFNELEKVEKEYLINNTDKIKNFSNKFQSYISNRNNTTIIDLAFEFSLPVTFLRKYFEILREKGFISLVYNS